MGAPGPLSFGAGIRYWVGTVEIPLLPSFPHLSGPAESGALGCPLSGAKRPAPVSGAIRSGDSVRRGV